MHRRPPLQAVWLAGQEAALEGHPIEACPYIKFSIWRRTWLEGWARGRAMAKYLHRDTHESDDFERLADYEADMKRYEE